MKLKKPLKKAVSKKRQKVLNPQAILKESEAWRRMLTDMHENLGYVPDTPDAKQAVAIEAKLSINSHVNGYAHITALAIVNGLDEPEVPRAPSFNQGLLHFLLAEIKEATTRGNQTYIAAVKNLMRWSLKDGVDPAIAVVVVETALSICSNDAQRTKIKESVEYHDYMADYEGILEVVGKIG